MGLSGADLAGFARSSRGSSSSLSSDASTSASSSVAARTSVNPLGSAYYLEPFLDYGIQYSQPNFNNPQVGYLVRQLYIRQAMQYAEDQPGISKAIWRGYATPDAGPVPNVPANQFEPAIEKENGGQGPYPYDPAKAKALLTSHGWKIVPGGVSTCADPAKCGPVITAGKTLSFVFPYASGVGWIESMMTQLQSNAEQVGIKLNLEPKPASEVGAGGNCVVGHIP